MNWIQRKIYLYNVTFGLYMLDWWERYLFNTLVLVLMWFIFYNSSRYISEAYKKVTIKFDRGGKSAFCILGIDSDKHGQVSAVKNAVTLKYQPRSERGEMAEKFKLHTPLHNVF